MTTSLTRMCLISVWYTWHHYQSLFLKFEPPHDKTSKMTVHPAKTQISLGIRPVWSESSLSAWRKLGSLATHWAHSEDSEQTGWMPRLIWVFPGRTATLLVLSWGCSFLWALLLLFLKKAPISFNDIWANAWDYGTYDIGDQRRLRQACASAQSRQSLRWSMELTKGPTKKKKKQTSSPIGWLRMRVWSMSYEGRKVP